MGKLQIYIIYYGHNIVCNCRLINYLFTLLLFVIMWWVNYNYILSIMVTILYVIVGW